MAAPSVVVRLSELVDGQEAVCYAILVRKNRGVTSRGQPFVKCYFRDRQVTLEAPIWFDHRFFDDAETWMEGVAYRLHVRAKHDLRYGLQLDILGLRPADAADAAEGFDFFELVESSRYPVDTLLRSIRQRIDKYIEDPPLRQLVLKILEDQEDLFTKMPAAQNMHHPYTSGLLEHVWSMTRVGALLADHYAEYYSDLNPPLNKGVVIAALILHDIGKIRELAYHPVEAKYTKEGCLIGHVLLGRDLVREVARSIEGFPEETLLLLEHAIVAHHGKREFGAPVLPQTIEAILVAYIDDLDAKMNIAARQRLLATTSDDFTDRVYALDNRRIYKGMAENGPAGSVLLEEL
jgi:3'-5' exoribonuclease